MAARPRIKINLAFRQPSFKVHSAQKPKIMRLPLWDRSAKWRWYDNLFVIAVAIMPALGEYGFSTFFLFLAAFSLTSNVWHKEEWSNIRKGLRTGGIIVGFCLTMFILMSNKGEQPWSHLSKPAGEIVQIIFTPKELSSGYTHVPTFPPPPIAVKTSPTETAP